MSRAFSPRLCQSRPPGPLAQAGNGSGRWPCSRAQIRIWQVGQPGGLKESSRRLSLRNLRKRSDHSAHPDGMPEIGCQLPHLATLPVAMFFSEIPEVSSRRGGTPPPATSWNASGVHLRLSDRSKADLRPLLPSQTVSPRKRIGITVLSRSACPKNREHAAELKKPEPDTVLSSLLLRPAVVAHGVAAFEQRVVQENLPFVRETGAIQSGTAFTRAGPH